MSAIAEREHLPQSLCQTSENDSISELWDRIFTILLERVNKKAIPDAELRHVVGEIKLILLAAKGRDSVWKSVIDVANVLIEKDVRIHDLKQMLPYSESTLYRALNRLEAAGVVIRNTTDEELAKVWSLNQKRCPVLYRASRQR